MFRKKKRRGGSTETAPEAQTRTTTLGQRVLGQRESAGECLRQEMSKITMCLFTFYRLNRS